MRIGFVIYGSLETLSGGFLYDRKLVEALRAQGDEVEIISMPWSHYAGHLRHNFEARWFERLDTLRLDVLLQDELNHPSLLGLNARLRKKAGYPIIAIVHHLRGSEQHPPGLLGLYRIIEKQYLRSLDGFVFNSQTTRQVVEDCLGLQTVGVVATPGGDRFGAGISEQVISARAAEARPLRILFVGNLIRRKGLGDLLHGVKRLPSQAWRLRVAGRTDVDATYTAEMQRLSEALQLSAQVDFLGRLDEAQLEQELRAADVLAVPSQYEGFGIVYLEGMSFGLPALASRAGAAGEIIQHGQSGWLVEPARADDIARCLTEVLDDRTVLLRMSLAARGRFAEFPGWEESAATIRAFLVSSI